MGHPVVLESRAVPSYLPRPFVVCLVLGALAVGAPPASADQLRVRPLVKDGFVLVTFALEQGFTDEVRQVVQSGLRTTFTYTVDLRLKVPVWVDRTVASTVISTTVEYDNLTRRYTISRTLDGRIEDSRVLEDEAQVRQLMTSFDRLPLFDTDVLELNREYYVTVRAEARPRSGAAFWPWGGATSGTARFTFIP
jgi:hypothetical protein